MTTDSTDKLMGIGVQAIRFKGWGKSSEGIGALLRSFAWQSAISARYETVRLDEGIAIGECGEE